MSAVANVQPNQRASNSPSVLGNLLWIAVGLAFAIPAFVELLLASVAVCLGPRTDQAISELIVSGIAYAVGVLLFSFGWEQQNLRRAARLAGIIVVCTALSVVLIAALFVLAESDGSTTGYVHRSGSHHTGRQEPDTHSSSDDHKTANASPVDGSPVFQLPGAYETDPVVGSETSGARVEGLPRPLTSAGLICCRGCGISYSPALAGLACPGCNASTPLEAV